MQHGPTHGLHSIGGGVKVPVKLVKAKQLVPVLGIGASRIGKTEACCVRRFQCKEIGGSSQRDVTRGKGTSALIGAGQQRIGPMAITTAGHQGAYHVHVGTSTSNDACFKVLHHPKLDVFKSHAVHQLLGRLAGHQTHQIQFVRYRLGQRVVVGKLRNV